MRFYLPASLRDKHVKRLELEMTAIIDTIDQTLHSEGYSMHCIATVLTG